MAVRTAAPDDVWLSTAHSSPRVCIAVDEFFAQEHEPYFGPVAVSYTHLTLPTKRIV